MGESGVVATRLELARAMNRLEWAGMNGRYGELRQALEEHSAKYLAARGIVKPVRVIDMEWVPTVEDQGLLRWVVVTLETETNVLTS